MQETAPGLLTWVATMPAPTGGQWTAFFMDLQFEGERERGSFSQGPSLRPSTGHLGMTEYLSSPVPSPSYPTTSHMTSVKGNSVWGPLFSILLLYCSYLSLKLAFKTLDRKVTNALKTSISVKQSRLIEVNSQSAPFPSNTCIVHACFPLMHVKTNKV